MSINATSSLTPESLVAPSIPEANSAVFQNEQNLANPKHRENLENLSLADKVLENIRDKLIKFQEKNGEAFNSIVSTGGKLTTGANLTATAGEPAGAKQFSPISKYSTKLNLFFTGLKGAFDGLVQTKDIIYSVGKATDALVGILPIPQELQFGLRVGPSLSNFATAIRQEAEITQYEKFTDAFKLAGKKINEYFNNVKEVGYLNTFKDPDKSLAFSVGAPVQAFLGSLTTIASYVPFLPKKLGKILKTTGYLNRFIGATSIDLYEGASKFAKSQYSGAAKLNFLGGAISDLVNKAASIGKSVGTENLRLNENSIPIKALALLETFTKNLTPTLESLGRVNNEKAIEKGVNNDRYKVTGFKGIMSRYLPSVIESMTGIPAKGSSESEILALQEREAILRGETLPTKAEPKPLADTLLVKEAPEVKNEIKLARTKVRNDSSDYYDSIYDYESSSSSSKAEPEFETNPGESAEEVSTQSDRNAREEKVYKSNNDRIGNLLDKFRTSGKYPAVVKNITESREIREAKNEKENSVISKGSKNDQEIKTSDKGREQDFVPGQQDQNKEKEELEPQEAHSRA